MFLIVEWVLEGLLSIIKYTAIVSPRKEFDHYVKGEDVTAKFQGKPFPARIVELSVNKKELEQMMLKPEICVSPGPSVIGRSKQKAGQSSPAKKSKPDDTTPAVDTIDVNETGESKQKSGKSGTSTPAKRSKPAETTVHNYVDDTEADVPNYLGRTTSRSDQSRLLKLENEMTELRDEVKSLRRKVRKLQGAPSSSTTEQQPAVEDNLACVGHLGPDNVLEVMKVLALRFFTSDELITHSLSGKRSTKCLEHPRTALDQGKLCTLQALVRSKCPSVSSKIFTEKMQNMQKVLRRLGK